MKIKDKMADAFADIYFEKTLTHVYSHLDLEAAYVAGFEEALRRASKHMSTSRTNKAYKGLEFKKALAKITENLLILGDKKWKLKQK